MTGEHPAKKPIKTETAAPRAAMLIESMRDIGYSLGSAMADIIDNSITAGADTISLFADTALGTPSLGILDNGIGMTYSQLLNAMRPGSRSPLDVRDSSDLGRFGLGMKTASFSQCRRLTVVTRHSNKVSAARWDLDYVAETDEWLVEIPDDPMEIPWADKLGSSGTLILWEKLDRLTENENTKEVQQHLVRRLDDAVSHLELVFHRFLSGERGIKKVNITLNNRALMPLDPFHSTHPATMSGPIERIRVRGHDVVVQAFTLPHHKKVSTADWERYAGPAGYTRNQGFYVYRGKRLIIHATWFGLARQMELTKLARVRIDLPSELDSDWKIDVRKSSAHPPRHVLERLRRIIETIGAGSKGVYSGRGRRLLGESRVPVWQRLQDKNEIRYSVNIENPLIVEFVKGLRESMKQDFLGIVELVGAGLPVDSLFADIGSQPHKVSGAVMSIDAYQHAVEATFQHLIQSGMSTTDVLDMLRVTEPFRSNWEQTELIVKALTQEMETDD
jgi:hypothetical protein